MSRLQSFRITFGIFLLVFAALLALGTWQIWRGLGKKELLAQYDHNKQLPALSLAQIDLYHLKKFQYRRIKLTGHFDNAHQFLVDNQSYKKQKGYYVLTPFLLGNNQAILVNRGWLPKPKQANRQPYLAKLQGQQQIEAYVRSFPPKAAKWQWPLVKTFPQIINVVDYPYLSSQVPQRLQPFLALLTPKQSFGFVRVWQPGNQLSAARHWGYALQWFLLAITCLIVYLFILRERHGS